MASTEPIRIDFKHHQTAHCESGVTSNLLRHQNIPISEAMAFGIGGGLFFGHFSFVKLNYIPLTSYRHFPGKVFNTVTRRLGVKIRKQKFSDQQEAMDTVDRLLEQNIPVGVQAGAYWLPYFPSAYRFHFNGHNMVIFGKSNGSYLISDPNFEQPVTCGYDDLKRARFSKGAMAPKGRLYYPVSIPEQVDLRGPIIKGINEVSFNMLRIPIPFLGVKGIRYLANKMRQWPLKMDEKNAVLHLGQVIRMQEEIGTGGAGFRFIFASFLQEASAELGNSQLFEISHEVTAVGDRWREFALLGSRLCKNRDASGITYDALSDILKDCADREESIFKKLAALRLK
jgi:hypothetical protein